MAKRLFDILCASLALTAALPALCVAAVAIRCASPGPVIYCARRVGRGGTIFTMYKFRTMHVASGTDWNAITAENDPRVFRIGQLLRHLKIDELPQLINVIRGDMSLVGPRPEDPDIVDRAFTPEYRRTLTVAPGLASPGSIYNYTHGEDLLDGDDPESSYVEKLLPIKMSLELAYVQQQSFVHDLEIMMRTVIVLTQKACGRRRFPNPPELLPKPGNAVATRLIHSPPLNAASPESG